MRITRCEDDTLAQMMWNLVESAEMILSADGGCREELSEERSSIYASAYMLQLLSGALADPDAQAFVPEHEQWSKAATEIVASLHRYMSASWETTRWSWMNTPWEVNAPYIAVDAGPWLQPELARKVIAALPEPLRALRIAYALINAGDEVRHDHRLARLRSWLLRQDWSQVRLRPCDVTFLSLIASER